MFVVKNNKLYLLKDERLVGVNYDLLGVTEIDGTETDVDDECTFIEPFEARAKFNIAHGIGYVFPYEKVEVEDKKEPVVKTTRVKKN